MFHRRRASSNPPAKTPPTAAASTAAVQAFLASRNSNANLSSAAAAAALRSRPTTPTPVGDLPTKRRAQRSGSVSSNGSARPTLQRQNSAGSMTERTFRDPSPSRNNAVNLYRDEEEPPPVPALPKSFASPPPVPAKSLRRPASVEPPERVASPVPTAGGRGVSLDRGPGMMQAKPTKKKQAANLPSVGEMERAQNRESINFSRPMSPQNSPPTSPLRELKTKAGSNQTYFPAPTANMAVLRDGEAEEIQYTVQNNATRPVKKKKKKVMAKNLAEGSHFAGGGGAKLTGTAMETAAKPPTSNASTPSPITNKVATASTTAPPQPAPKRKKKSRVVSSESSQGSYASDSDSAISDPSSSADRPRAFNTRAAGLLTKQPSIVREDREAEEQEEGNKSAKQTFTQNGRINGASFPPVSEIPASAKQHKKSASQPPVLSTSFDSSPLDIPGVPLHTSRTQNMTVQQSRPNSLSPARATHFLAQPMYESLGGVKHQPPARSVSPAKSALKHSPSSRGASPIGFAASGSNRLSGVAGSEASYDGSVVSDDSGKLLTTRKKGARVSFDEDSVVVGRASTPPGTDSPTILSPQHSDSASKGFLSFGRRRKGEVSPNNSDQDDGIKPTPTLPSFGSIRAQQKGENDVKSRRNDTHTVDQRPLLETQKPSSRVVGHVLSQGFASKQDTPGEHITNKPASHDPLPPEVTSVEGTGYHSDDEESTHGGIEGVKSPTETISLPSAGKELEPNKASSATEPFASSAWMEPQDQPKVTQNGSVPAIAIVPATPGLGATEDEQEDWFKMPGGFVGTTDDQEIPINSAPGSDAAAVSSAPAIHHATDLTPANLGIAEPEPESTTTSNAGSTIVGHVAEGIQQQTEASNWDESDDTGNSVYSDAAEDMSDVEGDGFGSINAIIESPVTPKTPFVAALMPESPIAKNPSPDLEPVRPATVTRNESELSEPPQEEGWDRAQAYWQGLSQSRKQQLERAAVPGVADEPAAKADLAPAPKEKPKKKKVVKKAPQSNDPPLPPWPDKEFRREVARPASPKAGQMKQSMRSSQSSNPQPQMRASMRDAVPPKSALRNSVQTPDKESAPQGPLKKKKDRPVSAISTGDYNKPSGKPAPSHGRAASLGVAPKTVAPIAPVPKKAGKPAMRRATSDGSDSSSSFKKTRPRTSDSGKYTMKRSMRDASTGSRPQSSYIDRQAPLSARATSPPARRPFSTAGPSGMRTSMRDSMDSGLSNRTKSPSRGFGFGRNGKTKPQEPKKTGARLSSRFGDSSDEDEGLPKRQSRFVDSSDEEEEKTGLTPVRGIPRRIDEGDSTDLEDSDASPSPIIRADEKPRIPMSATTHQPAEGSTLATGSLRAGAPEQGSDVQGKKAAETEKKKRSFFGSRRKQPTQTPLNISLPISNLTLSTSHPLDANYATPVGTPASPKTPKAAKMLGNDVTASSPVSAAAASPKSQASPKPPKLQRRNTPKRFASDSWPLPEMPAAATEKTRPNTADGGAGKPLAVGSLRPQSGPRRFTAEGEPVAGGNGVVRGKEKKKRFPMLRKALGL
ncbi:MAG: hypothetical protein Q9170_001005 [Blastenia crenularia]